MMMMTVMMRLTGSSSSSSRQTRQCIGSWIRGRITRVVLLFGAGAVRVHEGNDGDVK